MSSMKTFYYWMIGISYVCSTLLLCRGFSKGIENRDEEDLNITMKLVALVTLWSIGLGLVVYVC